MSECVCRGGLGPETVLLSWCAKYTRAVGVCVCRFGGCRFLRQSRVSLLPDSPLFHLPSFLPDVPTRLDKSNCFFANCLFFFVQPGLLCLFSYLFRSCLTPQDANWKASVVNQASQGVKDFQKKTSQVCTCLRCSSGGCRMCFFPVVVLVLAVDGTMAILSSPIQKLVEINVYGSRGCMGL